MIKLIVGTKGSGKTKAMIDQINEDVYKRQGVTCEQRLGEGCFQQDLVLGADMSGQYLPADLLGQRVHLAAAGLLLPLMHLRRKIISGCAAAAGVGEHMDLQEADLPEEGTAFFKVGLGLTGEAADAVGGKADRALPISGADLIHHLGILSLIHI